MLGKSLKPLAFAIVVFIGVMLSGILLIDTLGLALFNMVFGNEVYAVTVVYHMFPEYDLKGQLASIYFDFDISLGKAKVPIETILCSYRVDILRGDGVTANLDLHILVYVLNRIKLFDGTLHFEDSNPKQITIYLHKLNPKESKMVYVEITGYYQLGEKRSQLSYGGSYAVEG